MKYKCWECGKVVDKIFRYSEIPDNLIIDDDFWEELPSEYNQGSRCYCEECGKRITEEAKSDMALYIKLKKKLMFNKALRILEKQLTDMYDYKDAIEVVKDYAEEHLDRFDSSYEMVAAIVLVKNRIASKMQYKIGKYQVDFLLPDLYVVLEIDGIHHKLRKQYDSNRDAYIKKTLGIPWEIIRIKTDYLDKDAKALPEALKKVIEYREKGRVNWRELYK